MAAVVNFTKLLSLIFFIILMISNVNCDQLMQVNMLFRHGVRTPLECYPNDPYLPYWNQWPKGELMTQGMEQSFNIGLRLKQKYIDILKFMNPSYKHQEIYIRGCEEARCIQTAGSLFAGFYSNSMGTFPNVSKWPGNWSPLPLYSVPMTQDKLLQADYSCPRDLEIYVERSTNPKFIAWLESKKDLVEKIYKNTGIKITNLKEFGDFFDCVQIENYPFNFTLPSWLDKNTFDDTQEAMNIALEYVFGGPGFGEPSSHEMNRLRAGTLLKTWIENMKNKIDNGDEIEKIMAYSGHDTTIVPLLRTLNVKNNLMGIGNPDYAAAVVIELWKKTNGAYVVKAFYYPNANAGAINFTEMISGCPPVDECPYDTFVSRCKPYIPEDIDSECRARV